ncbi:uncharacterized protein Bfra_001925 [Botrytis fragariae]|uniref:Uncharacterized protein n=1 Tax=Botrytis fragariae TaxID=1964551 RepID=A0A8H6B1S3_9HELO|nr:uncharacterized protein Bfra_001925 [Botrytis fragariae]KAF5877558.1 hypothetical protein Bfra_001925 [Botrytis fragariae]
MPWPNSLSQRPPIPTPSEGAKNTTSSPSKPQPKIDEKADDESHPTPVSPTDPDRRFSFISPTTVIPTSTQSSPPPQDLTAEGLLALTSQPLSHGGTWSSASPTPRARFLPRATEKIYTVHTGDIYPKTAREIADDKRWTSRRKNRENFKRIEAKEEHLAQQRERARWFKPAKKIEYFEEEGAKNWGAWEKKKWY